MNTLINDMKEIKKNSLVLQNASSEVKNKALKAISVSLVNNVDKILEANAIDLKNAQDISPVMQKRLFLDKGKVLSLAQSVLDVALLDDPIGEVIESIERPNGLKINKVRVPFGTICAIFESRPNVCVDIATLCLKTGNACVLKGGKEAINTNKALVRIIQEAISPYFPSNLVYLVQSSERSITNELITMKGLIDLVTPRGGKGLIKYIVDNCRVPYIETGAGLCHIYVDEDADFDMALAICKNAKLSNPAVCNAAETFLIHPTIAKEFIPMLDKELGVKIYGCEETQKIITCMRADELSYDTEYNDLICNIKVCNLSDAISHIQKYSTGHSESIISNNMDNVVLFMNSIDSSCLYHNASTRFTDGGCFGMGAELGISTQKLHARGPMGLKEMTTYRYKIYGNGQIR